jgi:hypothetical protein
MARGKYILIRVSEDEHAAIAAKAQEADMSISGLMRDHLGKLWVRHRTDEARRHQMLNRINANLNMIARWVNTHKSAADAMPVCRRLAHVEGQIARLIERLDRG